MGLCVSIKISTQAQRLNTEQFWYLLEFRSFSIPYHCSQNPCGSNEICDDNIDSYSCVCKPDFTGEKCKTKIDDCDGDPFKNYATTLSHVTVEKVSLEQDVKLMLMTVMESYVRMVEPVKMESLHFLAYVHVVLLEQDVKLMLMTVMELYVTMVEPVKM